MFIIDSIQVPPNPIVLPPNKGNNSLAQLALLNEVFSGGLRAGLSLLLVEVAGVDDPSQGHRVTLKLYLARDADDPFFPANNFEIPEGDTRCCQFNISQLSTPPNTPLRIPAVMRPCNASGFCVSSQPPLDSAEGFCIDSTAPASGAMPMILCSRDLLPDGPALPFPSFEQASFFAFLSEDMSSVCGGLAGALRVSELWRGYFDIAYCEDETKTSIEDLGQPDVDLDFPQNGLDRVDTREQDPTDRCFRTGPGFDSHVPPPDPDVPLSCVTLLRDGYSAFFEFTAVRANVLGVVP